jgi:hypothetical protein
MIRLNKGEVSPRRGCAHSVRRSYGGGRHRQPPFGRIPLLDWVWRYGPPIGCSRTTVLDTLTVGGTSG